MKQELACQPRTLPTTPPKPASLPYQPADPPANPPSRPRECYLAWQRRAIVCHETPGAHAVQRYSPATRHAAPLASGPLPHLGRLRFRIYLIWNIVPRWLARSERSDTQDRESRRRGLTNHAVKAVPLLGHFATEHSTELDRCGDRSNSVSGFVRPLPGKPQASRIATALLFHWQSSNVCIIAIEDACCL